MPLNGKFLLNGADIAPLSFPGVGTFMAFSGNGAYKNRGGCGKHPGVLSDGCITLVSNADFRLLRNALINTPQIHVPCKKDLMAYGMIEVVSNGYNICS